MTFEDRLKERIDKINSHLCVGLDPREESITGDPLSFLNRVIDEVKDAAAAFKPNIAYFEALGVAGYQLLETVIRNIPADIPVILDAKRSDIPETQKYYARAYFERWNVSAVTLNPYLGFDSCEPFLKYEGKGVYLIAVTSNSGAADIQMKNNLEPPVFETVFKFAERARRAAHPASVGFVAGLTNLSDEVLQKIPDAPLLIPGLGAQGGDLKRLASLNRKSPVVINVSRGILYDSAAGAGFRDRAMKFKEEINHALKG